MIFLSSRRRSGGPGPLTAALLASCVVACVGQVGGGAGDPSPGGSARPRDPAQPGAPAADDPATAYDTSPGLRRLTRPEYINSVADLLAVPVTPGDLPDDQIIGGHSAIAGAHATGYEDSTRYLDVAESVAEAVAPKLVTAAACADAACYQRWASDFLTRAFREPPAAATLDRLTALLSSTEAGATPAERMTAFLEAVLVSPHFLYRKEIGTGAGANRTLRPHEIATRLSFLLWQSGPDADLLAAAGNGEIASPAARLAQVDRMLKDSRATRGMRSFVGDWMGLFDDELAKKAPEVLNGLGTDFPAVAQRGFDMLLDDALGMNQTATFSGLLSLDYTFANPAIAKVIGATVSGSTFTRVMLKTAERRGILMHPLVLGSHTKESGASPFTIGRFVFENVLCDVIPPPPAMFPPVEDTANDAQTLRQKLEAMTANQPCANCHDRIGPPGYAFLPFDAVGRYKNKDARGQAYDTTGSLKLPGGEAPLRFDSASDLAAKMAGSAAIQRCVARRMFRWTYGRYESPSDRAALDDIEQTSIASATAVAPLLRKVVGSPAFAQVHLR